MYWFMCMCTYRCSCSIMKSYYLCSVVSFKGNQVIVTVQALSDDDRRAWLQVMEGREPVSFFFFKHALVSVSVLFNVIISIPLGILLSQSTRRLVFSVQKNNCLYCFCMCRVLSTGGGGWGRSFYPKHNIFPPKT